MQLAPGKLVWAVTTAHAKDWQEGTVTGKPAGGLVEVELLLSDKVSAPTHAASRQARAAAAGHGQNSRASRR